MIPLLGKGHTGVFNLVTFTCRGKDQLLISQIPDGFPKSPVNAQGMHALGTGTLTFFFTLLL